MRFICLSFVFASSLVSAGTLSMESGVIPNSDSLSADQANTCKVQLCHAHPQGPYAEAECREAMNKFHQDRALKRPIVPCPLRGPGDMSKK